MAHSVHRRQSVLVVGPQALAVYSLSRQNRQVHTLLLLGVTKMPSPTVLFCRLQSRAASTTRLVAVVVAVEVGVVGSSHRPRLASMSVRLYE